MAGRLCTECEKDISHRDTKALTCGDACRQRRHHRLADERKVGEAGFPSISNLARGEATDIAREEARKVIGPVVREALDESVMEAVRSLVGLTPAAVAALQEDLENGDGRIRQNAYVTLFKYTVGHPVIGPKDGTTNDRVVINLGLPRPGTEAVRGDTWTDGNTEGDEEKECDTCGEFKPAKDFVGMSTRCVSCFALQQQAAADLIAKANG